MSRTKIDMRILMKQNSFRKQKVHTDLNKLLNLAKIECDEVMYFNLLEVREYINHLEAQNLGLRTTNENLMERLEKNIFKFQEGNMWVMAQNKQNLVNVISGERLFVDDWSDIVGDYKLVYECRNCSEGVVLAEYKTEKQCAGALCELALELSELEKVVDLCSVNQCD